MDSGALNMSDILHNQKYGYIKTYDPEVERFYVVQFR